MFEDSKKLKTTQPPIDENLPHNIATYVGQIKTGTDVSNVFIFQYLNIVVNVLLIL